MLLICNPMHWFGHLFRIADIRLPKQLFYKELQHSRYPRHKPKKCFKDVIKNNFRALGINIKTWEQMIVNPSSWKKMIYKSSKAFVWNKPFRSKTWTQSQTLYSLNLFVSFLVNQPCWSYEISWKQKQSKTQFYERWFSSSLQITCVNSVTKYVALQQVWQVIWMCMGGGQLIHLSHMQ